ncbi:hypothetical protein [Actinomycetospora cinnamomea]|uniref:Anti-sigma-M factor RsmA n=1 Tax=Actinomycetospora cinnamomea TaxID=663609 RepID=A0A2U1FFJ2_9PSEU|nr:hypothetical protein [Actinomycetospora cinnamomea]PVZ10906.1 hypothetical protein C8D89_104119 [Actinomycetospora cinnamomea]
MSDDEHAAAAGPGRPDRPDGPDAVLPGPQDPEVATALARTQADLAAHAARTPPMPPGLLADIDRALAAERSRTTSPGAPGIPTPPPPRRRRGRVLAALAAAAAVAAVVAAVIAAVVPGRTADPPAPSAAPTAPTAPTPSDMPVLAGGDGPAALRAGLGRSDYGPLADPDRLAGCLAAHGVPAGVRPVGARQVVVDGRPGVLLVLPTGIAARFRLLAVGPDCAAGVPLTLSDTLVGR